MLFRFPTCQIDGEASVSLSPPPSAPNFSPRPVGCMQCSGGLQTAPTKHTGTQCMSRTAPFRLNILAEFNFTVSAPDIPTSSFQYRASFTGSLFVYLCLGFSHTCKNHSIGSQRLMGPKRVIYGDLKRNKGCLVWFLCIPIASV